MKLLPVPTLAGASTPRALTSPHMNGSILGVRHFIYAPVVLCCCSVQNSEGAKPSASKPGPSPAPAAMDLAHAVAPETEPTAAVVKPAPADAAAGEEVGTPRPSVRRQRVQQAQKTPASPEECHSTCRGRWGRHGLSRTESCLCRTTDSGKECRDGLDCQGECIVDEGASGSGALVGQCSEFERVFGCWHRIPRGAAQRSGGSQRLPPKICLD